MRSHQQYKYVMYKIRISTVNISDCHLKVAEYHKMEVIISRRKHLVLEVHMITIKC